MKYDWDIEKVRQAVRLNSCYNDVLRQLKIPVRGNNCGTLKRIIADNNIDISHFTGRASSYAHPNKITDINTILIKPSSIKSSVLKQRLIEFGIKQNTCIICGKPITSQAKYCSLCGYTYRKKRTMGEVVG